ncbi:MAG: tail fiber domain-containing protein [Campylobacterales bacterium]|nr:tail fiber domain-containing protein [Campylobacterales bacterium]
MFADQMNTRVLNSDFVITETISVHNVNPKDFGAELNLGMGSIPSQINIGSFGTPVYINESLYGEGGGVTSMGPFGSTGNAFGGEINGNLLILQPADGGYPGAISAVDQAISGVKSFYDGVKIVNPPSANILANMAIRQPDGTIGISDLANFNVSQYSTAYGIATLGAEVSSQQSTAFGFAVLNSLQAGNRNNGFGTDILSNLITGNNNCAFGGDCIHDLTAGDNNSAFGVSALNNCLTGTDNCMFGYAAGSNYNGAESNNIIIGSLNLGVIGENNVIRLGNSQTKNYQAGIRGVTTDIADALPILISSGNQLGTISSDRELKENITYDFGDTKTLIKLLKPCKFSYKSDKSHKLVMGCIADEFKTVLPEYVIKLNDNSNLEGIQYQYLDFLMLKEIQRLQDVCDTQQMQINSIISKYPIN